MIPRFEQDDLPVVGHFLGKIVVCLGVILFLPLVVAILAREWVPAMDFCLGALTCLSAGGILLSFWPYGRELNWRQGMVLVSLTWFVAMLLSAIPLFLSGHFSSFLDASFECMSAYATTGLVLVADLDHLSYAHNFWRHLMCFVGGQGIILVALVFFLRGGGALRMYVGEGRDAKILPNIITTSRFIWMVSLTYLIIGSSMLTAVLLFHGLPLHRAVFHGICIFMAAWDTAGFAPQSINVLYYHSPLFEMVTIIVFLLGAVSFGVHYAVWTGKFAEMRKNFEVRVLLTTILTTYTICLLGFPAAARTFPNLFSFFRTTFYQVLSGHTGAGYTNLYPQELARWSELALLGVIFAMAFGGCTNSTAGAIKALRIGLFFKGMRREVRKLIYPDGARVREALYLQRDVPLDDEHVRIAMMMILAYVILFASGALLGTFLGYGFVPSLFESVSAAGNVGLSVGITCASMPQSLKIWYIFEMWAGRLEFFALLVLARFFLSLMKR